MVGLFFATQLIVEIFLGVFVISMTNALSKVFATVEGTQLELIFAGPEFVSSLPVWVRALLIMGGIISMLWVISICASANLKEPRAFKKDE